MSEILKLSIALAIAVAAVGCGGPKSETTDAANLPTPTETAPAGGAQEKAAPGMIDDFSVNPAPSGAGAGNGGG